MKPSLSLALALAAIVPCLTAQSQMPRSLQVNFSGTTVIDEPGTYIMPRDMDIPNDRVAIDITASGVTLDLGGRSLRGPGGKLGTGGIGHEQHKESECAGELDSHQQRAPFGVGFQLINLA